MLLSREEMSYDFQGAKLDPVRDRELLAWIFNQCLYGEVTGIQCGHWLYNAPDLDAARFLAKQSLEEFQHVDNFLQCLAYIDAEPEEPHKIIQFLTTGMMPENWEEHVSLEMAQGEGLVLMAFYAMIDTLDHPEIVAILSRAVKQEERHVEFGEQRTMALVEGNADVRRRLLGLNLVSMWSVNRLAKFVEKKIEKDHPLAESLPGFLTYVAKTAELRMQRVGLIDRPLSEYSKAKLASYVAYSYGHKGVSKVFSYGKSLLPFVGTPERLTDNYLGDSALLNRLAVAKARQAKLQEQGDHPVNDNEISAPEPQMAMP
jgi:1,2-phenylacetyl-CoA epoxidase catalytic subunit